MQTDMHYYGTYAMARAAGITPKASQIIATCAQFVDDNASDKTLKFANGAWVESVATAHHALDTENLNLSDQRRVWIPFHFLPGNEGDSWTERLKCRMDSPLVREMTNHHLSLHSSSYGIELIGIAAHVYADTFSHYGFSGISSRGNRIISDSIALNNLEPEIETYVRQKFARFKSKKGSKLRPNFRTSVSGGTGAFSRFKNTVMSFFAQNLSGGLGHGAVATFPDRPYLEWAFDYERSDAYLQGLNNGSTTNAIRPNPDTFLKGCEALHTLFSNFRKCRPDLDNKDYRKFSAIKATVNDVLHVQADMAGRIEAWHKAAASGLVFDSPTTIPIYRGVEWNDEWAKLDGDENSDILLDKPIWHFHQAAAVHRTYVLRDLLPSYGIVVN